MAFDPGLQRSEIQNVRCAREKAKVSGTRRASGDRRHSSRERNRSRVRPHAPRSVTRHISSWPAPSVREPNLLTSRGPATLDRAFPELFPQSPAPWLGTTLAPKPGYRGTRCQEARVAVELRIALRRVREHS